jgi:hypothetical protein
MKSIRATLTTCLLLCAQTFAAAAEIQNDKAPFDPSKGLKDYAGKTIIGSKSSATGRSDSVIAGEHAEKCAELLLRNCTGLQV